MDEAELFVEEVAALLRSQREDSLVILLAPEREERKRKPNVFASPLKQFQAEARMLELGVETTKRQAVALMAKLQNALARLRRQ